MTIGSRSALSLVHDRPKALIAVVLALALLPCLIPLFEGRAWNGIGPLPFGLLYPPEGYQGPLPGSQITAETWGASGVVVPFHARLNRYVRAWEAPLWNPDQGLGQPFAAEGEGCPYSPVAVLRALLPYTWANLVTLAYIYVAAFFFVDFLRGFGLSTSAALVGAVGFEVSGALILQLARPNLADQLCTIPIMFWAARRAVAEPSCPRLTGFALAAALHALGGFIQIAMLSGLLVVLFSCFYAATPGLCAGRRARVIFRTVTFFMLGNGLAAFFLLPLVAAMQSSFGKNIEHLAFAPEPWANLVAFSFPVIFGPYFQSWIPGAYPKVVDWDNLFAFAGTTLSILVAAGWAQRTGWHQPQRRLFLFFGGTAVVLLFRFISFPPLGALNLVPLLGRQSPKHALGVAVFMLATAAAFASDSLRAGWDRRSHLTVLVLLGVIGSCVVTLAARQGGWVAADQNLAIQSVSLSLLIVGMIWMGLAGIPRGEIAAMAVFALVAECAIYLPLGEKSMEFLWGRFALFVLILLAGWNFLNHRRRIAGIAGGLAALFFAAVIMPHSHLPDNVDLTKPSEGLQWLRQHLRPGDRIFGAPPEFSSLAALPSLDVLGPLAPPAFHDFVRVVTDDDAYESYRASCVFMLGGAYWRYPLSLYQRFQPIFDAAGIHYLLLDRTYFGPEVGDQYAKLLREGHALTYVYVDGRVRIIESRESLPPFRFASRYRVLPGRQEILSELHNQPSRIEGDPCVEAAARLPVAGPKADRPVPIHLLSSGPNRVALQLEPTEPGLLVTHDVFDPDWQATVNGARRPLVRVNGLFRGIYLEQRGPTQVIFSYRPPSLVWGSLLSTGCGIVLVAAAAVEVIGRAAAWLVRPAFWAAGCMAAATLLAVLFTYFVRP